MKNFVQFSFKNPFWGKLLHCEWVTLACVFVDVKDGSSSKQVTVASQHNRMELKRFPIPITATAISIKDNLLRQTNHFNLWNQSAKWLEIIFKLHAKKQTAIEKVFHWKTQFIFPQQTAVVRSFVGFDFDFQRISTLHLIWLTSRWQTFR